MIIGKQKLSLNFYMKIDIAADDHRQVEVELTFLWENDHREAEIKHFSFSQKLSPFTCLPCLEKYFNSLFSCFPLFI